MVLTVMTSLPSTLLLSILTLTPYSLSETKKTRALEPQVFQYLLIRYFVFSFYPEESFLYRFVPTFQTK